MSTQAHVELWASLKDDLRVGLGEDLFERWIAPIKVLSEEGIEIRLGVANKFVLDWVEKRYMGKVREVLESRCGPGLEVCLVVDPALFDESRRDEKTLLESRRAFNPGNVAHSRRGDGGASVKDQQTLESFVVGATNRHAHAAAMQVLDRPGSLYNPLFVYGTSGVGKTHLLKGLHKAFRMQRRQLVADVDPGGIEDDARDAGGRSLAARGGGFVRVAYLTGEQFFQQYVASIQDRTIRQFQERYRSMDVLIIDDVHLLENKRKTQTEFLHTFSALADTGRQVILASDVPPKSLKELDGGLVGRFASGLVVGMKRPDGPTRLGIARAQARRLTGGVDDAVLQFLAEHVRGNAREVAGAVKQVHHHAQMNGGTISMQAARAILEDYVREHRRSIDATRIREVVAAHFGLAPEKLESRARDRRTAFARQIAMYLSRQYTGRSLAEVGKCFGNRNHATVKCAEAKVARLLQPEGSQFAKDLEVIKEALEE